MSVFAEDNWLDETEEVEVRPLRWKVLIVDDEPDVHQMTRLCLRDFSFAGRGIELLCAESTQEARDILKETHDIAVALIDVVMEADDSGLKLVEEIRNDFGFLQMRIIIRTGQSGLAPERYVIDYFDIDDYKDKSELTSQKLYSAVRLALKSYRNLVALERNLQGLQRILAVTPDLYNLRSDKLEDYFRGVLLQLIGICKLGHSGMISTIDALAITLDGKEVHIRAGAGDLEHGNSERRQEIVELCSEIALGDKPLVKLRKGAFVAPLEVRGEVLGFLYIEAEQELSEGERELIRVLTNQCAAGLDNLRLHHNLEECCEQLVDMLGQMTEFKEGAGSGPYRIQEYTRRLSLALGLSEVEAELFGRSGRLHDVGKVGVPDSILQKPEQLSADEFNVAKGHSGVGEKILKRNKSMALASVIARSHHERWDGSGYPDGLSGEAIPYAARIVAVIDVFDALISTRPYRAAWSVEQAADEILKGVGSHFDPVVAETFVAQIRRGAFDDLLAAVAEK